MAKQIFKWLIDAKANATHRLPVRTVQFGDGYEQRQPKFLKTKLQKWSCEKTAYQAEIEQISAFFDGCRGVESFYWDSPNGRLLVKVGEYQTEHLGADAWKISFEFEEVMA